MEHQVFSDGFKANRQYLEYGNYYPSRKRFVNTICGAIMCLFVLVDFLLKLAVGYMCLKLGAWMEVLETLNFTLLWAAFLVKLLNFLINRENLVKIERFLKHPILNDLDLAQKEILDSYANSFRRFSGVYRILCWLSLVFYGIFKFTGLLYSFENQTALVPDWFPVDAQTYWFEIFGAQFIATAVVAFHNPSVDVLNCFLINFGSAQFDILKNKLENAVGSCRINGQKIQNEALNGLLRTCAKHHQILIAYTQAVQDTFSAGVSIEFFCSVLVICLSGFQMLMASSFKSAQFVFALTFLIGNICEISMHCWFGNVLSENSSGVPQACYISDWLETNGEARKLFWIIMERGKTPVTLKAGKFFKLSLPNLMALLKSSYSYFAVLQHLTK